MSDAFIIAENLSISDPFLDCFLQSSPSLNLYINEGWLLPFSFNSSIAYLPFTNYTFASSFFC